MEFMELAKGRYSVRKFSDAPIEPEKLESIVEAGMVAPTGKNNQPQRIYIAQNPGALAKIAELSPCTFGAPIVLVFTYNTEEDWTSPYEEGVRSGVEDVSIVATHMMLRAWEIGIGSCWVNLFPNTELERALGLPAEERSVLLMPIGYAAEDCEPAPRHALSKDAHEVVSYL